MVSSRIASFGTAMGALSVARGTKTRTPRQQAGDHSGVLGGRFLIYSFHIKKISKYESF